MKKKEISFAKNKIEKQFLEVVELIERARHQALKSATAEMLNLYWQLGEYISKKIEGAEWGLFVIDNLADYLQTRLPDLKGMKRRGLYRMKQFYETYKDATQLFPLLKELPWSCHLHILAKTKSIEEKEFYLRLAIKERYTVRELERQIDSGYYERYMLSDTKVSPPARKLYPNISSLFRDTYLVDFLNLPHSFSEKDLQKAITQNLKYFILEFGKDFAFVGEEYRLQVGNHDFFIDLLFFHRDLRCLVAFELKIDNFKPEHLGQLNFYLEALDRDIKKSHENPSVGVILCKSKDAEVVEYALSRNLSPALVAEYQSKLIDKKLLQHKLHELFQLSLPTEVPIEEKLEEKSAQILHLCLEPQKRAEIFQTLGLANQTKNFKLHVQPLLAAGYLSLTIPDKPKSKNQRYLTTEDGLHYCQRRPITTGS
jgi:predicted nuclease of restriction endonuclease-like (RecB) superfamily